MSSRIPGSRELKNKIVSMLWFIPDKLYLKLLYRIKMGKKLNIKHPKSFNEKIQWLKLYDRNPAYTTMVDKYKVKRYVSKKIGEEYIIPTLGVWDKFDDIDFCKLPNQFVLKCTHDSGGLVICKDKEKFDVEAARKKINKSLKNNFFWVGREWPYKNIRPRIIAEQYLEDESGTELKDYKFMCFDGKVRCIFVCSERYSKDGLKVTFFDRDWNKLPFIRHYPSSRKEIQRPAGLGKMIELSEKLSKDIPFVRVDLYESNDTILFGELTFYPGNGLEEFEPEKWDFRLGSWIKLKKREYCK